MPEVATDPKSPKTPRRLKASCEPFRQVHFQSPATIGKTAAPAASSSCTSSINTTQAQPGGTPSTSSISGQQHQQQQQQQQQNANIQPQSFPQLGAPPNSSSLGPDHWHTSADPSQSVKLPGQLFAGAFPAGFTPASQQGHFFAAPPGHLPLHPQQINNAFPPQHLPTTAAPITYIGLQQQQQQPLTATPCASNFTSMADYQNAAPLPMGVNFQPPVPDTTFGPIPHVYVPRFDGGFVPVGVQVGLPSVQFVSAPAIACSTITVHMPKTYYYNGYTYYASLARKRILILLGSLSQQPTVAGVPFAQPSYVVAQQPAVVQQPIAGQQPVMINGQPVSIPLQHVQAIPTMGGVGVGGMPVIAGNSGQFPDVSGLGRTVGEETVRQLNFAHSNRLFEPQEFKPSDDDPSRFYYVREVDGNWTQRNRFTIDHLGDCRWYVTDEGWFYAVRMPN